MARRVSQGSLSSPTLLKLFMDSFVMWLQTESLPEHETEPQQISPTLPEWDMTVLADDVKVQANNHTTLQKLLDVAIVWAVTLRITGLTSKSSIIRKSDQVHAVPITLTA